MGGRATCSRLGCNGNALYGIVVGECFVVMGLVEMKLFARKLDDTGLVYTAMAQGSRIEYAEIRAKMCNCDCVMMCE